MADEYQAKGNYEEAATYYYNALLKNRKNSSAARGLQQNGQLVLNDKFTTFSRMVVDNQIEDAMKQYRYAEKYAANAAEVGVVLSWPYEYAEVYEDIKQEYINTLFDQALVLMNNKKYDMAEKRFEQIATYDSAYKDVSVLRMHTVLEPLYNRGLRQLQTGKYQDAFKTFNKLCSVDEQFKDVKKRRDEAGAKATVKLGILPVHNLTVQTEEEAALNAALHAQVKTGVSFLSLVHSDELKPVLEKRGFTKLGTEAMVMEAAKSVGLQYAIWVVIHEIKDSVEKKEMVERTAYEAVTENIPNPYTGTYTYISKFKKINYRDSYESRMVSYKVSYALYRISDQTKLTSEEIVLQKSDQVHRYFYNGKINNLYENLPVDNQMPPPNQEWRERFTNSHRQLLPKEALLKELQLDLLSRVNKAVSIYIK